MNNPVYLCTPGPTRIPDQVQKVMAKPIIHHRSKEFQHIFADVRSKLNCLLNNMGESILISSSGSGGMEASVAGLLNEGDAVVVVESGKFGQRWVELAQRYKLQAHVIHVPWGKAVTWEDIEPHVDANTKALLIQACETSTGVYHPVNEIGPKLKQKSKDALMITDAITALGIHRLDMQEHALDVVIGGSQKALMCPPGVSTVSLSPLALTRVSPSQTMYLSLEKELSSQKKNASAFTPAVSIIRGLQVALDMMFDEGLDNLFERHAKLSQHTRSVFSRAGMKLFNSDQDASHGITVVGPDLSWDVGAWMESLKETYNLWIAGGQEHLKGRIFRYAHMGYTDQAYVDETLTMLFESLQKHVDVPAYAELIQKEAI